MKIAFLRYPEQLYKSGKIVRGGSEIANQSVIDYIREKKIIVKEFSPGNNERIKLIDLPAIGTPLMFQELITKRAEINQCDIIVSTNWFGVIIPEITKPIVTIFHHDAKLVMESTEGIGGDDKILKKWLKRAQPFGLATKSSQRLHDSIISIEEEYLARISTKIIAVSGFLKDRLVKHYNLPSNKIEVIYNAYPQDWLKFELNKDFFFRKLRVVTVSRLPTDTEGFTVKAIDRLLEVSSRLKGFDQIIIGSTKPGVYDNFFAKYLPNVVFLKNQERDRVGQELAKSHISLCLSRCESFGLAISESMFMGNIPVSFPTGVAKEVIRHGHNGFIVKNIGDVLKTVNYLNKNRSVAQKIGQNARQTAMKEFSPQKIADKYLNLLQNCAESR